MRLIFYPDAWEDYLEWQATAINKPTLPETREVKLVHPSCQPDPLCFPLKPHLLSPRLRNGVPTVEGGPSGGVRADGSRARGPHRPGTMPLPS